MVGPCQIEFVGGLPRRRYFDPGLIRILGPMQREAGLRDERRLDIGERAGEQQPSATRGINREECGVPCGGVEIGEDRATGRIGDKRHRDAEPRRERSREGRGLTDEATFSVSPDKRRVGQVERDAHQPGRGEFPQR